MVEHIGAGLAALGVIGPGIGIGHTGRNVQQRHWPQPDAAGQIRGLAIILAGFAEGSACLRSWSACWRCSSSIRTGTERIA